MNKELEKEAENWLRKYLLCCNCKRKCTCIQLNAYCEEQVLKSYIAGAEPREKRIAELEKENAELKRIVKMVAMINKGIYTEAGVKAIYAEAEKFLKEE